MCTALYYAVHVNQRDICVEDFILREQDFQMLQRYIFVSGENVSEVVWGGRQTGHPIHILDTILV